VQFSAKFTDAGLPRKAQQQLQAAFHRFAFGLQPRCLEDITHQRFINDDIGSHGSVCIVVYDDTHSIEMGGGSKWFFIIIKNQAFNLLNRHIDAEQLLERMTKLFLQSPNADNRRGRIGAGVSNYSGSRF
jgi:hypothetical protein